MILFPSFMTRRRALLLLVLALGGGPLSTQAIPSSVGEELREKTVGREQLARDIAGAGRVRMQAQRIAKLYQQASMGIYSQSARQQMVSGVAELHAELSRLTKYRRILTVDRVLARCVALADELQQAMDGVADSTKVARVNQLADELMIHAGRLALAIEGDAESPVGRLLDLSSRLNMLSQRLARLFLMAFAGDQRYGVLVDIDQARKEFRSGLAELESSRDNSREALEALALAKTQWFFFDEAISKLHRADRGNLVPAQHVATSSERIGQMLDVTTAEYVKDYARR